MANLLKRIFLFYSDGFRSMTVGKKLWTIIILKLIILFLVLKLIFFPNFLNSRFRSDRDKGDHVREELLKRK